MQSLALEEKDKVTYFGQSKKYYKNGIAVAVLGGMDHSMRSASGGPVLSGRRASRRGHRWKSGWFLVGDFR